MAIDFQARCFVALLLIAAGAAWSWPVHAQVKRCAGAGGELIYTDRKCEDIGAVDRLAHAQGTAATAPYRGGCARRLNELVSDLSTAIDLRDVNRLAMVYDWAGMSTHRGYAVMGTLDAIAQRPLVDVVPIYGEPPPIVAADGTVVDTNADGYFPQTTLKRAPIGLRLEQTYTRGLTPSRTTFGLRKRLGCWWVTL